MSEFDYKYILGDTGIDCLSEQIAEELVVFTELSHLSKLMLKVLPDVVAGLALGLCLRQQNFVLQTDVELSGIFRPISHLNA